MWPSSDELVARLLPGAAAIFLFHGVLERRRDGVRNYTGKHLPLDEFVRRLDALAAHGAPVSLPKLAAACRGETPLPDRAFAVTFDDGFANNHTRAAPVLAERGIPATFYVTANFVEKNEASWIDRIEYAVERAESLTLELPFSLGHAVCRTAEEKIGLLGEIRRRVKSDRAVDPYALADEIWRQLGIETMEPDPELDEKLTWDQVRELGRSEFFTIGGHGLTHRILEHLEQRELEREIAVGLDILRRNVDEPVEHFSYPEGLADCYSDRVIEVLRTHGITCAVTAEPGLVTPPADLFRLKRILVA